MTATPAFALRTRTPGEAEPDLTSMVVIHRAMGQDLQRLAGCLGEIPAGGVPPARARAISRYTAALLAEISAHHANQDGILWPLIAATAGQSVDLAPLTDDHQALEAAAGRVSRALASFGGNPASSAVALRASVSDLRDLLDEHIADEEKQIFPVIRRYLPAEAYAWCEHQIQRKASLAGRGFSAPWLARHAQPDELSRLLAAGGWPAPILLALTRAGYARLERQAFGSSRVRSWRPSRLRPHIPITTTSKGIVMKAQAFAGPGKASAQRQKVRFASGGTECAAWHYPGANGACVIMAGGFAATKEPATDLFAKRFHDDGFAVLAFDYRRLGESGGQPRQVVRIRDELADWQAAISCAQALPGVDPDRLVIWGFSLAGGHVFRVAARNPQLAAAIAQTPNADGPAATRNAARYQKPLAMLRLTGRAVADGLGGLFGRAPRLVPLAGPPGTVAVLTTPDGRDGDKALNPGHRYPDWQQAVAARSVLPLGFYRPGRDAARVRCPLMVVVCDQDQTVLAGPAAVAADRAPRGELVRLPGGHYAPFLAAHEQAAEAELSFLRQHLVEHPRADRPAPCTAGRAPGGSSRP